jgi:hypothetical protein
MNGSVSVNLNTKDMWAALTGSKKGDNVVAAAIVEVLDTILESKVADAAFNSVMIANNTVAVQRNNEGSYPSSRNENVSALYAQIQKFNAGISSHAVTGTLLQATVEPNIAGIPISSASIETNREIEISESQVIVQSTSQKKYLTDNAVPRLKEWTISGYLTSLSPIDQGTLIKPSLQWQAFYLDICASSRRPVTFKTNRGEFVKVQITNLHTSEEASYNNAIKVEISLKEFNPYFVSSNMSEAKIAIKVGSFEVSI